MRLTKGIAGLRVSLASKLFIMQINKIVRNYKFIKLLFFQKILIYSVLVRSVNSFHILATFEFYCQLSAKKTTEISWNSLNFGKKISKFKNLKIWGFDERSSTFFKKSQPYQGKRKQVIGNRLKKSNFPSFRAACKTTCKEKKCLKTLRGKKISFQFGTKKWWKIRFYKNKQITFLTKNGRHNSFIWVSSYLSAKFIRSSLMSAFSRVSEIIRKKRSCIIISRQFF